MTELLKQDATDQTRSAWTFVAYGLIVAAILAFIGYFIVYNIYAFSLFKFPFDYDQGEGFELMDTLLFSQGKWPYLDNNSYPFYSSNYPPLFHLVVVPLIWLFGPQFWTGRLIAYLGTLVTGVLIGFAVHRETKRLWIATLSGLAFFASNYVYHVGPLFRQHMFMVMLETVAVVMLSTVVSREERTGRRDNRGLFMVMVFLLLAGYTKQLAYATVAAVFSFLFLRQTKRAILWAIPFAITTGIIFLLINLATDGQWLTNTITANVNPYIPAQGIGLYRQWLSLHTVITVAAAILAFYQLYFERLSAYSVWFIFAAANGITAGKWGAGESYFATAIVASCILTGLLFGRVVNWSERKNSRWYAITMAIVAILFLFQASQVFHMPTHTPTLANIARVLGKAEVSYVTPQTSCSAPQPAQPIPYLDSGGVGLIGRPPNAQDTRAGIRIAELVSQGNTAAFSEEAGFNLYADRDVITNPTQLLNLYNNGQVDLTQMLDMLEKQAFDTVIFRAQFYPPPVLEVIGRRYQTDHLIEMNGFVYCVLTPRELSS